MRRKAVLIGFIVAAALVGGCAAPSASVPSGTNGATTPLAIVAERCTKCHPVARIKAASHDAAAWKATVERMRLNGAQLTDAETQQVIDFLAGGGASGL